MEILNWITANWLTIVEGVSFLVAFASVVVRLTPTEVDNQALDKALSFLSFFGLYRKDNSLKLPLRK